MAIHYAVLKGKVIGGMRAEVVEQQVNSAHAAVNLDNNVYTLA